ncbi:hypothetical protein PoB_000410200 [Plakobranchus ocellatus]|uniref:Uncharacterized protein n=1 Tax=Plakobranchus ocellatus TaxID=259542 RepID=A0AAV3Y4E1_9GAST|nr:hypothetical protein PoB_000410200 [Plakobranchus ocellatus]
MENGDINKAENFLNNLNSLTQTNQDEDIDRVLTALLSSSLSASPPEDLNDLDDISNEYTELNNTIDALNSYLDVWEERHENLKAKIREALADREEGDLNTSRSETATTAGSTSSEQSSGTSDSNSQETQSS